MISWGKSFLVSDRCIFNNNNNNDFRLMDARKAETSIPNLPICPWKEMIQTQV